LSELSVTDIDSPSAKETPQRKNRRPRNPEEWIRPKAKKPEHALEFRPGAAFFALADRVVTTRRTLLGYDRLYVFWQAVRNVVRVPGSAAEIGSYRGGSAYFIASAFVSMTGEEVPLHVFDTFAGHPEQAITDHDQFQTAGQFGGTSVESVREYLSGFRRLQIHQGDVLQTLPDLEDDAYRLVHIDTDLYRPTRACLEYFTSRMSTHGVIVVDDYGSQKCPGVPNAVREHLARSNEFDVWDMGTEQLMLVKR
jgi:macrocin-O-methyltransferase TylF-like protien